MRDSSGDRARGRTSIGEQSLLRPLPVPMEPAWALGAFVVAFATGTLVEPPSVIGASTIAFLVLCADLAILLRAPLGPSRDGAGERQSLVEFAVSEGRSQLRRLATVVRAGGWATHARPTVRDNLGASLFASVLVAGLFVDGWAHVNVDRIGTFVTLWHVPLYVGFTATAGWILTRNQRPRQFLLRDVPAGYGLALVGLALAGVALGGDIVWHALFGVETGLRVLLAPFHLLLFGGMLLVVASTFHSAWSYPHRTGSEVRDFAPALLSLTLVTAMATFFLQYLSPFATLQELSEGRLTPHASEPVYTQVVGAVILTNLVLIAPVLLVVRRWRTPFGAFTFLFGATALFDAFLTNLSRGATVGAALIGGLTVDLLLRTLRDKADRPIGHLAISAVTPMVLWLTYFLLLKFVHNVGVPAEIWLGAVSLAILSGATLALLMYPTERGHGVEVAETTP
jgi:hypothetical protein